jgi:hypothetical protein
MCCSPLEPPLPHSDNELHSCSPRLSLPESQYAFQRRTTRPVMVGAVQIGGGAPVSIQSMTNTHTYEAEATIGTDQAA